MAEKVIADIVNYHIGASFMGMKSHWHVTRRMMMDEGWL